MTGSASGFFRGRIRIRIKMIWIRNTALNTGNFESLSLDQASHIMHGERNSDNSLTCH
jgi:hypothetical protein